MLWPPSAPTYVHPWVYITTPLLIFILWFVAAAITVSLPLGREPCVAGSNCTTASAATACSFPVSRPWCRFRRCATSCTDHLHRLLRAQLQGNRAVGQWEQVISDFYERQPVAPITLHEIGGRTCATQIHAGTVRSRLRRKHRVRRTHSAISCAILNSARIRSAFASTVRRKRDLCLGLVSK